MSVLLPKSLENLHFFAFNEVRYYFGHSYQKHGHVIPSKSRSLIFGLKKLHKRSTIKNMITCPKTRLYKLKNTRFWREHFNLSKYNPGSNFFRYFNSIKLQTCIQVPSKSLLHSKYLIMTKNMSNTGILMKYVSWQYLN